MATNDGLFIAERYYSDPVGYARDILQAEPDKWQSDALQSIVSNQRLAVASGHGVGKTACIAMLIHWFMSTRPNPQIVVTANTEPQLSGKTWRELAKWHQRALNKDWFDLTATRFSLKASPQTWFAQAQPWSEQRAEAFAGTHEDHVLIIMDEASAIADVIWDVCEGAMTTAGARWVAFGNPTRNTGRFRECWGRFRHRWQTLQVDSRTAKAADQAQIKQWLDDYGEDSDFFRVRVKGEFPRSGSNQLISSEDVQSAVERLGATIGNQLAPVVLGVDVARFGDDSTCIAWRQGRQAEIVKRLRGADTMAVSGCVADMIKKYNPQLVTIDEGGLGAGVVDRLRELGYKVSGVNFGASAEDQKMYRNKRAEMWGRMRDWLKIGHVPDDKELQQDLIGPEYFYHSTGSIQLESKDDMKRRGQASPDAADALALTFAFNVATPQLQASLGRRNVAAILPDSYL